MRRSTILLLILGVLVWGACAGCQQKFTRQRYETIYLGMPDWEVQGILGDPTGEADGVWSYVHHEPYYSATIQFEESRVKDKRWSYEKPKRRPSP